MKRLRRAAERQMGKCGKHVEFIQAVRTLVESNQAAKEIRYNGTGYKSVGLQVRR